MEDWIKTSAKNYKALFFAAHLGMMLFLLRLGPVLYRASCWREKRSRGGMGPMQTVRSVRALVLYLTSLSTLCLTAVLALTSVQGAVAAWETTLHLESALMKTAAVTVDEVSFRAVAVEFGEQAQGDEWCFQPREITREGLGTAVLDGDEGYGHRHEIFVEAPGVSVLLVAKHCPLHAHVSTGKVTTVAAAISFALIAHLAAHSSVLRPLLALTRSIVVAGRHLTDTGMLSRRGVAEEAPSAEVAAMRVVKAIRLLWNASLRGQAVVSRLMDEARLDEQSGMSTTGLMAMFAGETDNIYSLYQADQDLQCISSHSVVPGVTSSALVRGFVGAGRIPPLQRAKDALGRLRAKKRRLLPHASEGPSRRLTSKAQGTPREETSKEGSKETSKEGSKDFAKSRFLPTIPGGSDHPSKVPDQDTLASNHPANSRDTNPTCSPGRMSLEPLRIEDPVSFAERSPSARAKNPVRSTSETRNSSLERGRDPQTMATRQEGTGGTGPVVSPLSSVPASQLQRLNVPWTPESAHGQNTPGQARRASEAGAMSSLGTPAFDVFALSDEDLTDAVMAIFDSLGLVRMDECDRRPSQGTTASRMAFLLSPQPSVVGHGGPTLPSARTSREAFFTDGVGGLRHSEYGARSPGLVPRETVACLVERIREAYLENNYHNWRHAVDVLHTTFLVLSQAWDVIGETITMLDLLCVAVAALAHDMKHFGVSNMYLTRSEHTLAYVYNDTSILENMHASALFITLSQHPECNVFKVCSAEEWRMARKTIIGLIMDTDMSRHFDHISNLEGVAAQLEAAAQDPGPSPRTSGRAGPKSPRGRAGPKSPRGAAPKVAPAAAPCKLSRDQLLTVLGGLIHMADLGHTLKPVPLHFEWSRRVMEEFFAESDQLRDLDLTPPPFMDGQRCFVPGSQADYLRVVVAPYLASLVRILPGLASFTGLLVENYAAWCSVIPRFAEVSDASRRASAESKNTRSDTNTSTRVGPSGPGQADTLLLYRQHLGRIGVQVVPPELRDIDVAALVAKFRQKLRLEPCQGCLPVDAGDDDGW